MNSGGNSTGGYGIGCKDCVCRRELEADVERLRRQLRAAEEACDRLRMPAELLARLHERVNGIGYRNIEARNPSKDHMLFRVLLEHIKKGI